MKNNKLIFFILCAMSLFYACTGGNKPLSYNELKSCFKTPPADVRTGVYWYWMNDNISVEGVEKDLEAMKKAGITKAFIGNIGGETQFPVGKVKIFTDEWWEVVHAALKKATELDIEIGMFNCPGWSQSGGPWIRPNQSMRYLAFVDTVVEGNIRFSGKLPISDSIEVDLDATGGLKPNGKLIPKDSVFEDVKVLAVQLPDNYRVAEDIRDDENATVTYSQSLIIQPWESKLLYKIPRRTQGQIDIHYSQPQKVRTLELVPDYLMFLQGEFQVMQNGDYKTIKSFKYDFTQTMLNVGWNPLAPLVLTFPETEATDFRLIIDNIDQYYNAYFSKIALNDFPAIERYPQKTLAKMHQNPAPQWDSYMFDEETTDAALCIDPEKVLDISDKMAADGTIEWDVPAGKWLIMRTGMLPTGTKNAPAPPEGKGLEVDKMNKDHVAYHFDHFMGEVLRRIPKADRRSLKFVIQDSYEMGGQNMTDNFLEIFKKRYGYDPTPYLPAMQGYVVGNQALSDRFLWDLRRLIADKISYDFVGGFREVSHKHGLKVWLENYGHWGFPGEFLQYGGQSDGIGGEFWAGQSNERYEPRIAASCGHIYGKNVVSAESFTSAGIGYKMAPKDLKFLLDWSMAEGINEAVLHVYIEQPYDNEIPGIDAWFATEFNRHNTWFSQLDLFTDYIRRSNFMLRQGLDVADVAYFIGEDAPKMTGIRTPEIPRGYNYDYINAEVIERDLQVKNGKLTLPHGTSYRVLVLPPQTTMRPELLRKIEKLVKAGATIVSTQIPDRSPSLENYPKADEEVKTLAAKMWCGIIQYGKGKIYHNYSLEEVFAELNLKPDFIAGDSTTLYTHRTDGDREIYFVANQTEKPLEIAARFRVSGKQPELWNATDGSVRLLTDFSEKDGITTVPLSLDNLESCFVVFAAPLNSPTGGTSHLTCGEGQGLDISTDWTVSFQTDSIHRGLENVVFDSLQSWSANENPQIKYYSGTAVYTKQIIYPGLNDSDVFIEFENVADIAKVKINGQYAGGCWTAPYRVNISGLLKDGENAIEVEVVNKWGNRLIGDSFLPFEQRKVRSYSTEWRPDMPLQPSGLIGKVRIVQYNNK